MYGKTLIVGNWSACCNNKSFKVNNNGMKLCARCDEELERITFDMEKKTVSVSVKNPTLSEKAPRVLDLSNGIDFFEKLRRNVETLLTQGNGGFETVTPNIDRTIFEIR